VFGRRKLPVALTPRLDRDERVLAWAAVTDDGGALVATNRGLWLPVDGSPRRLGWHEIHKASWADGRLTLVGADTSPLVPDSEISVSVDTSPESYQLDDPGNLPKRIRERVTASVAYTSLHQLPGGGSVRVVGRRVSGRDGLSWFVRYEGKVDRSDPAVIDATSELVTAARDSINEPD
jgi:hypothetical protein